MSLARPPYDPAKVPLPRIFYTPQEVVRDRSLSLQQKKQFLADWASDRNAVESKPALRRHPVTGIAVNVAEIIAALRALDHDDPKFPGGAALRPPRFPVQTRAITSRKRATGAGLRIMVSGIEK
jgi:hypothetical protein